jgi:tetratricopeptide (TPR) repeat protein
VYNLQTSLEVSEYCSAIHYINFANAMSGNHKAVLIIVQNEKNIGALKSILYKLLSYSYRSNGLEQAACRIVVSLLLTTFGTVQASSCIGQNKQVSTEVLAWLSKGLNSDVTSNRLKLASVYYCTGDMVKTEFILRYIENQYFSIPILPCCSCWDQTPQVVTKEFTRICNEENVDCVKRITAFCVKFIKAEINCVPHELQYEMFRSTQDDMLHRHATKSRGMDWSVIDSLIYLYFLQYKTYRQLGRFLEKQQALRKLSRAIAEEENLGHRETALNILGQCMEQENRPQAALNCYIRSLHLRARNNAARVHICRLLCKLSVSKYN